MSATDSGEDEAPPRACGRRHLSECAALMGPEFSCTCDDYGPDSFGSLVDAPEEPWDQGAIGQEAKATARAALMRNLGLTDSGRDGL